MPLTFIAVVVAIISMSGLPPLMGFGGKWLLFTAMMDVAWYFLRVRRALRDLCRLSLHGAFRRGAFSRGVSCEQEGLRSAEALLIPPFVLIAGYPRCFPLPEFLIDPVSAAIDPYFHRRCSGTGCRSRRSTATGIRRRS